MITGQMEKPSSRHNYRFHLCRQAPSQRATKKAGEWQTMRIRCNGGQCCVWINGQCIIDVSLKKLALKAKNVTGLKRTRDSSACKTTPLRFISETSRSSG